MSERHQWVIDRFEGDLAVVEVDGEHVLDVPRWMLPDGAGEDDVIAVEVRPGTDDERAIVELRVDPEATAAAREEAAQLIERLRRKDPGGDVVL